MIVKDYLKQAFYLDRVIKANRDELERLRSVVEAVPSSAHSGNSGQAGTKNDRLVGLTARIIDCEREIHSDIRKYINLKFEIREKINSVSDLNLRLILQKRYLNFQKWEEIAVDTGVSFRHVLRLHKRALTEFEKFF
jgi:DNA-directed RNA polymerase specialized sigma subunit